jgi:hypothetical protein
MQGLDIGPSVAKSFQGGYSLLMLASLAMAACVPGFAGAFSSLSA